MLDFQCYFQGNNPSVPLRIITVNLFTFYNYHKHSHWLFLFSCVFSQNATDIKNRGRTTTHQGYRRMGAWYQIYVSIKLTMVAHGWRSGERLWLAIIGSRVQTPLALRICVVLLSKALNPNYSVVRKSRKAVGSLSKRKE